MKWLQNNPVGMILASISGVFALLVLAMAIAWNLPVSVETAGQEAEVTAEQGKVLAARQVGALKDYLIVNEKPVFNDSRHPVIAELDGDQQGVDATIEVRGAPEVKLTGVVITSNVKIASLTPADSNLETVMAHEGESLTGEFVGWQVAAVHPRTVVLESRDGQSLEFDLQIHDMKIQEPPKPVAPVPPAQAGADAGMEATGDGEDEPLSRAEQIRQRIAERREELRLEQETQQSDGGVQEATAGQPERPADYQSAIRALMKNKSKDQGSNDKEDG